MTVMMKCGHAANAETGPDRSPACAICAGLDPGATVVAAPPDLTGREMVCSYSHVRNPGDAPQAAGRYGSVESHRPRPSSLSAAFFEYRPDHPYDIFYCGCFGWD